MNEVAIEFNNSSPQNKGGSIIINIGDKPENNLLYKFMVGADGTWNTLKDFSTDESVEWIPGGDGKYIIMIQAKRKNSVKPFDYVSKTDYIIGKTENYLIKNIYLDKEKFNIGDKITINVEAAKSPVVYRYWIKENDKWELVKDYSPENNLVWSVKDSGVHEILVECKALDSKNKYDDMKKIAFEVVATKKLEITNFRCLVSNMLVDNELIFQVDASYQDNRMILYKFIKICPDGTAVCVQDYSTKRIINYIERQSGEYKLLCLAKDMYSPKEYDDRAIINYFVKPYKDISIQSFTTDLSSPQICETPVLLKTIVKGGKNLLYRYIIDGNYSEDSGYIRNAEYLWNTKKSGKYQITVWVKDASFQGNYEVKDSMDFSIDEEMRFPVTINEVLLDKGEKVLVNEVVNIKVFAKGGLELRYSFIVRKNGKETERVDYGTCNWVNFTPEIGGSYEIEVMVKDKYSKREYDAHYFAYIEAYNYIPANIDYILTPSREYYVVNDTIGFSIISQNTSDTLIKYILKINNRIVEETEYIEDKKYIFQPRYSGEYQIDILARNVKSSAEFDCKREISIMVNEALPVTNTKINCDKIKTNVNEPSTFSVECEGGKEVEYEFYLMENNEWKLVQRYSRKAFYSFIAFKKGKYKILALVKSGYRKCSYEDYDIIEFEV